MSVWDIDEKDNSLSQYAIVVAVRVQSLKQLSLFFVASICIYWIVCQTGVNPHFKICKILFFILYLWCTCVFFWNGYWEPVCILLTYPKFIHKLYSQNYCVYKHFVSFFMWIFLQQLIRYWLFECFCKHPGVWKDIEKCVFNCMSYLNKLTCPLFNWMLTCLLFLYQNWKVCFSCVRDFVL